MIFRKIVSHLAYSPAMIWQLANYNKKIKKDQSYNIKISLLLTLNAVIILSALLLLKTPNPASPIGINLEPTAYSLTDRNLISTTQQAESFSQNGFFSIVNQSPRLAKIYSHFRIDNSSVKQLNLTTNTTVFPNCQEISYSPINANSSIVIDDQFTVYARDCQSTYYGLSMSGKINDVYFTILNNGNLLLPFSLINTSSPISETPLRFSVNIVNPTTLATLHSLKTNQLAKYIITATNTSTKPATDSVKINLNDVAEYSQVFSNAVDDNQIIHWQINSLSPNASQTYEVTIKAPPSFSNKSLNLNSPFSYNCRADLIINNHHHQTPVDCSVVKTTNLAILAFLQSSLNYNKLTTALLVICIVLACKLLHTWRIRIIIREIRLIRHKINQGTI